MHSYGGTAGCEGLGVYSSEAQANPTTRGRVVKLVFLSALLLDKGQSAASHQIVEPGEESGPTPQISPEGIILPADRDDQVARDITKSRLYNETPAEVAEAAMNDLTGFSLSAYIEPTKHRGWDEGVPATYVLCGKDQAWPLAQQAKCIEMLKQTGVEIEVVKRDGWDHSPYLGHAGEVAEIVEHACTMAPA
ncbi:hypothetical protein B0A55_07697 [Friedmanniomyces simplex]|uniref:AB hydrolase-1 domain-containing protein n=1 Tax=Friedmanniomyces simplex TaxID=329884 RepID=A0A4U0X9W2_9PEZI|nr:hypothetical protein B0A55_07697 [Friedmanniomyces simplex]